MTKPLKMIAVTAALLLLLMLVLWLGGAFESKIAPGTEPLPPAPVPNETLTVESTMETTTESATGTINAREETTVSARIIASIRSITARAGDTVGKGDILIELDDRELRARVAQAEQSVAAAEAALTESAAQHARVRELLERNVASRAEFDRTEAQLKQAQAALERHRRQLEETRTALSFSVIRSPIDGKVIGRFAEPGDTASPGQPLLSIYNPNLLRLDAQVRESLAGGIGIGDALIAYIDAVGKSVAVTVDEIVPSADPGSRSVTVKALLPMDPHLYPGMFGRLIIPTGSVERIYVPPDAVKRLGQLEFVRAIEDGRPVRRYIRTGATNDEGWIEVLSGLRAGEIIARQ